MGPDHSYFQISFDQPWEVVLRQSFSSGNSGGPSLTDKCFTNTFVVPGPSSRILFTLVPRDCTEVDDRCGPSDQIDIVFINIDIPPGTSSPINTYPGNAGIVDFRVSFSVRSYNIIDSGHGNLSLKYTVQIFDILHCLPREHKYDFYYTSAYGSIR